VDFNDLVCRPDRRREWLLRKALESMSLGEAVMLVERIEDFLIAPVPVRPRPPISNSIH
jgi:hypothetical protein